MFIEMEREYKALRLFGFLLPKKDRRQLRDAPAQLDYLAGTVDSFYDLLGVRNWVFHDDLNVTEIAGLVSRHANDPVAAEQAFITWYQANGHLSWLVRRLHAHEALRARMELLQLALEDYYAGRYYAVVQVLISVMDGFVNDLNPANRQGLHARAPEEMDAWNSVVGHHMGLASAHKTFTKSFKARSDEPVHELYRHGIVHGMLTDYNNVIVATKAWNRLFAVADWARAQEAEQREILKPPDPTWRDRFAQQKANAEANAALAVFTPTTLTADDPALLNHPAYVGSTDFLQAWRGSNYGGMAKVMTSAFGPMSPGEVRRDYQGHSLTDFQVNAIYHHAAAVCTVAADLTIDDQGYSPELRWMREGPDGDSVAPNETGEWRLRFWGLSYMVRNAERDA